MFTQTEVPLACSLLNFDQPIGELDVYRSMAPMHFLDFDVICVTTRKTLSNA